MTKRQEFTEKWNQIQWEKRNELALAIQADCRNIIAKIEAGPFEEDHPVHLKNAKYVLFCCRSDAVEECGNWGRGELHPDWNEVHDWTLHFFMNDFFIDEHDTFQFPITKKVWMELRGSIGKCWYCGDENQELVKDGMCMLCSLK
jgi:hypothetical protein